MEEAVLLDAFWIALGCNAPPATQLALAGTSRLARSAIVQYAPKVTLTLQLLPPPTPDTLAVLRNSGRVLPTTVIISNNSSEHCKPLTANRSARRILPQLSCVAITTLQLGGRPWLVGPELLASIHAALPGLHTLVLHNIITLPCSPRPHRRAAPAPAHTAPALAWPSLRTVSVGSAMDAEVHPASSRHLLAKLGIRAGGGVTNLTFDLGRSNREGDVIRPMLRANQLHALRKLSLPRWDVLRCMGADQIGGLLIRHAPALEHLKAVTLPWRPNEHGTSAACVPWRILEVQELDLTFLNGLPLGSQPGQPPLILRVTDVLWCSEDFDTADHLVSTTPGKRRVQLECTQAVYDSILTCSDIPPILCALKMTSTGLSNLILDGIDSPDDIKDLVDLSTTGIIITMTPGMAIRTMCLEGLHDLPQVTLLELGGGAGEWLRVDEHLVASLPEHVTDVCLSGGPSVQLVARMCVQVSRLPHRQARPLRLYVPGVLGWFDAVAGALTAAGINAPGVVEVPDE